MEILASAAALAIGIAAGIFSAMFGIGGAMLLIPALRIVFGLSGHAAIATALPITIPTAIVGATRFHLKGLVKVKTAMLCGVVGSIFSIAGALATGFFDGSHLMWAVGILFIMLSAVALKSRSKKDKKNGIELMPLREKVIRTIGIGVVGGFVSGFFGIGGGAILVPLLMRLRHTSISVAAPTSLAIIAIYSIPGALTHFAIGNVDMEVLLPAVIGSVLGIEIAIRFMDRSGEALRSRAYTAFLAIIGILLIARELVLG